MRRALDAVAEFVALINNDVAISPDWLRRLLEAAAAHPEAGLFTGTLLFHGEEVVNSTGLVIDALGRARDRDFRVPVAELTRTDGPVAGVSGGAPPPPPPMLGGARPLHPRDFPSYRGPPPPPPPPPPRNPPWELRGAPRRPPGGPGDAGGGTGRR